MATLTAQIIVGSPHPCQAGINPTHYLFLSEDDRPEWMLVDQNIFQEVQNSFPKVTWLPAVEHMLEDAFLMIAIHVIREREIVRMAKDLNIRVDAKRVDFSLNLDDAQRGRLYRKCRKISEFPKLIISIFKGSTIENQLSVLEHYKMDVEVSRPR
jgi:hypothetical protein